MECSICLEDFNSRGRRPKCLPCGHTFCLQCLTNPQFGVKCPFDKKAIAVTPEDLADNFVVLDLIEKTPVTFWCESCRAEARPACADSGHGMCSLKARLERRLRGSRVVLDAARKRVQVLEAAEKYVQGHLQESIMHLHQLEEEHRQSQADGGFDVVAPGGWENPREESVREAEEATRLMSDPLTVEVAVRGPDGGVCWRADVDLDSAAQGRLRRQQQQQQHTMLRGALLQLHAQGHLAPHRR